MQELEKILERGEIIAIEELEEENERCNRSCEGCCSEMEEGKCYCKDALVISAIKKLIERIELCGEGWISVEERLPECEEEVFIQTERGTRTTALYEDGTMREEDSIWNWCDIDGDWDEERDCMIIPKGWWEYRHFNPDDVYNNVVDEKVVAWCPLPGPYRPERSE